MADTGAGESVFGTDGTVGGRITTRGAEETGMVIGLIEMSAGAVSGFSSLSLPEKSHFSAKKTTKNASNAGTAFAVGGIVWLPFIILSNFAVPDSFPQ